MPAAEKHFTLEEARALIPALRPRLREMARLWREILPHRPQLRDIERRAEQGGATFPHAGVYFRAITRLTPHLDFLREAGVQLKDPASGLVDFPSLRGGRVVYLCWRMDEETITHWHETDAGFAGRRPLGGAGP